MRGAEAAWRAVDGMVIVLAPNYAELGLDDAAPYDVAIVPFDDVRCQVVEGHRPEVVSFHFGLPADDLLDRVRASGARVIASATTVPEAQWLADHGCDAVIAQGVEAGEHRGMFLSADVEAQIGTMALVPQVVDAVDLPVIAAGHRRRPGDRRRVRARCLRGPDRHRLPVVPRSHDQRAAPGRPA